MMKPFDLEAAKAGAKVVTRDGRSCRIVCFDTRSRNTPLLVLISDGNGYEDAIKFSESGKFYGSLTESSADLFMAPTKREGWVNVYQSIVPGFSAHTSNAFSSEEAADNGVRGGRIACVKITWEE